jgi:hypothetical protein
MPIKAGLPVGIGTGAGSAPVAPTLVAAAGGGLGVSAGAALSGAAAGFATSGGAMTGGGNSLGNGAFKSSAKAHPADSADATASA